MATKQLETILFNWDKSANTGSCTLLLDVSVLRKYALPDLLYDYDGQTGKLIVPIEKLNDYNDSVEELRKFTAILEDAGLSSESPYHKSNILYILNNFMLIRDRQITEQQLTVKLNNMVYLLQNLMGLEDYKKYNLTITGKLDDFKYSFLSEEWLKEDLLQIAVQKIKARLKNFDRKVFEMVLAGATEKELESAIKAHTFNKIEKSLIADLVNTLIRYFNTETISLKNLNKTGKSTLSNKQGDFIHDLLVHFNIYKPKKLENNSAVKHHDAIRKLIKRSSPISEDKKK